MARSNQSATRFVVAIESWTCNDPNGNAVMIHRGSRWRSDHWVVKRRPELFLEDGATGGEILQAREAAAIAGY
jgi:hypothetical protein